MIKSAIYFGSLQTASYCIYNYITGSALSFTGSSYSEGLYFIEEVDGVVYINNRVFDQDNFDQSKSSNPGHWWWCPINEYNITNNTDLDKLVVNKSEAPKLFNVEDSNMFNYAIAYGLYDVPNIFIDEYESFSANELLGMVCHALLSYSSSCSVLPIITRSSFMDYIAKRLTSLTPKEFCDYILDKSYSSMIQNSLGLIIILSKYFSKDDRATIIRTFADKDFFAPHQRVTVSGTTVKEVNLDIILNGAKKFNRIVYAIDHIVGVDNEALLKDIIVKSINKNKSNKKINSCIQRLVMCKLTDTLLEIDSELMTKLYPDGLTVNEIEIVKPSSIPETSFEEFYGCIKNDYTDSNLFPLYSMVNFLPVEQFKNEVYYVANFIEPHIINESTRNEARWGMLYNARILKDKNTLYNKDNVLLLADELGKRFSSVSKINKTKLYVYLEMLGVVNDFMKRCDDAEIIKTFKNIKMERKLK